jgi:hypothetical protein
MVWRAEILLIILDDAMLASNMPMRLTHLSHALEWIRWGTTTPFPARLGPFLHDPRNRSPVAAFLPPGSRKTSPTARCPVYCRSSRLRIECMLGAAAGGS